MWSWWLEGIGLFGVILAGHRIWWAWIILLGNAVLWTIYGFTTQQYGFCTASIFYAFVYGRNCYRWFHQHKAAQDE